MRLLACLLISAQLPASVRIKEVATIEGVRDNQLLGYGLVVGLAGTGDRRQTIFPAQTLTNLLERMGVSVPPNAIQVRNTAAVIVTGTLPPFAQPGGRIDVTVSAIGDSTNLQGGLLILTPLKGANGQVYAAAQGPLVTGGFVAGRAGNNQTTNHPTVGRIPNGAIIEREAPTVVPQGQVQLQLKQADFTTASRLADAINRKFPAMEPPIAKALHSGLVSVSIPAEFRTRTADFVASVEGLSIEPDRQAKIVMNERTGTIVLGREVRIQPISILHGSLTVEIQTTLAVSQPAPFSTGTTTVTPQIGVGVKEEKAKNISLQQGATVEDLVRALLGIGSRPRDIIAILQSLRAAGALDAELEVI